MPAVKDDFDILAVINDAKKLYGGDLRYYYRILHKKSTGLENPYHNCRHILHVVWLCYKACLYYRKFLTARKIRSVLIAAMFHDFDHRGFTSNDDLNIELALRGLRKFILPEDKPYLDEISDLVKITEHPPKEGQGANLDLPAQILLDADRSQALSTAWIQQIMYGLSAEMETSPEDMLERQVKFLGTLSFVTEWAQAEFPQSLIDTRVAETEGHLLVLLADEEEEEEEEENV